MIGESPKDPKVSVLITAYNHGPYIAQALAGVLAQRVPFEYEVIVGEDASSDDTRAICERMEPAFEGRMRLLNRPRNLGMMRNFRDCLRACRGRYVAFLEGDDFWISSNKLAAQVELMDAYPETTYCFTHALIWSDLDELHPHLFNPTDSPEAIELDDLFFENPAATCTVMLRRGVVDPLPDWMDDLSLGDFPLLLLHAKQGSVRMLPRLTAVYRRHGASSWAPLPVEKRIEKVIEFYDVFDRHTGGAYNRQIELAKSFRRAKAVEELLTGGRREEAQRWYSQGIGSKLDSGHEWISSIHRQMNGDQDSNGAVPKIIRDREEELAFENAKLHDEIVAITSSLSWRITKPLRRLRSRLSSIEPAE